MKVDADTQQRLSTALSMILEFYKVLMGTFLVVFVPQQCNDKTCTMSENFFNGKVLNTVGNSSNVITFLSIGTLYVLEYQREHWCIKYLDIDDEKSTNNLDNEIEAYPKYKKQMARLNRDYLYGVYISSFLMIVNFIISGFTVYQSYAGTSSITSFLSFFMLVSMKLYSAWNVGRLSLKYERANSAYMKEPKTYNTIDADYRIKDIENDAITCEEKVTTIENIELTVIEEKVGEKVEEKVEE